MRPLLLLSAALVSLSGCAGGAGDPAPSVCPAFPVAGDAVADELVAAGELPATWAWLEQLHVLDLQLEACRGAG